MKPTQQRGDVELKENGMCDSLCGTSWGRAYEARLTHWLEQVQWSRPSTDCYYASYVWKVRVMRRLGVEGGAAVLDTGKGLRRGAGCGPEATVMLL